MFAEFTKCACLNDSSPVPHRLRSCCFSLDAFGETRVSFSATTTIDRNDFGVSFNAPIPGLDNAMLLSDTVAITLDVEAVLQSDGSAS
jgi:polyisoprenoid-binding protein YceI